jgi:hypothetical protein
MRMRDARTVARRWVEEEASSRPGFLGAYLAGSITALPDDATLPGTSDVDIKVVLDIPDVAADPQKHLYRGVVLDVSWEPIEAIRSPEAVLGSYFAAGHFTHPCIIADPTGHLAAIQETVRREHARRTWVRARAEQARQTLEESLARSNPSAALPDQVLAWLFPIVFTPPMVLVADLRNPTHRRGLATMGQVLARHGHSDLHERVLGIVGSAAMPRERVETLLAGCTEAFDIAQAVRATPFPLASNISDVARPMAIGGAEELIADGCHREALPWIAFIHTLCIKVLRNDAPAEIRARFTPGYEALLGVLGVPTSDALAERKEQLRQLVPDLRHVAEEIIDSNPAIRD